ncbi:MAG: FtsX-like permease family protein [Roseburia sp.]|nr:FtsX-like permease family protein [Roseburia sp.]MCM1277357.1 FtsX-like permease family protein [Robinsoniella sp.]
MWLKKIRKKKVQSIFIVLILMVCSMLMTSSLVIMTAGDAPYKELTEECGSPIVKIYPFQKNDPAIAGQIKENMEKLDAVEWAEVIPYHYVYERIEVDDKESLEGYFFDIMPWNDRTYDSIRMLEGSRELKEGQCLIPAVLSNLEGIKLGDILHIESGISYQVTGIYADPYNMNVSYELEIIVKENPSLEDLKYQVHVFAKQGSSGDEVVDAYREQNDGILEGRAITLETRIGNNQITERIIGGILLGASVVILLISGIMIRYMIKSTLLTEKKTIAIYKMLGYKNRKIIFIYLKFYGFLVVLGTALGSSLSKVISDSFTKNLFRNLGVTSSSSILSAGILCSGIIIVYALCCVYLLLRVVGKIRPMEVFRNEGDYTGRKQKNAGKTLGFSPLHMAMRMIFRDRKNTCMLVLTCIMAAYCINFATTAMGLLGNFTEKNYYWLGFDRHDVSFSSTDLKTYEKAVEKLEKEKEVERVIKTTTQAAVSVPWEKGMGDTILSAMVYDTYENLDVPVLQGRNPIYPDEIAMGSLMAEKMNKQVGDYVDIYFNGNQKATLLLCGTYQSLYDMGKSCRLLGKTLEEKNVAFQYEEASIYLKENVDKEEFLKDHEKEYEMEGKLIDRKEKYANILNTITEPQMLAIGPFMVMAILLGGLNIIAIVYLKNMDNRKRQSIYKAIGYSSGHLVKANITYVFLIALFSLCITIPAFIVAFPKTMVLAFSAMGFKEYPVSYNIAIVIISNLGTLAVYLLSALAASKSLYDNPISELTSE